MHLQNLLCLDMAASVGAPVPNAFSTWFAGAAIPALVGLVATPVILYKLMPPEVCDSLNMGCDQ
jgi:DASS family divalent anion:Na+ symporter